MRVATSKGNRTVEVDYHFGDNLEEMIELFGSTCVYDAALDQLVIRLQSVVRSGIKRGDSDEEIANRVAEWKPGARAPKKYKSPREKLMELIKKVPQDQQAELINELRAEFGI